MNIKIKKLHEDAIIPNYAKAGDAGMDLYSIEDCIIGPGQVCKIKTGIATEIPDGYVCLIWDKSGLATNHSLKTVAGVIDCGYRGEYLISIINLGKNDYQVCKGDKIAQMLIQKVESPIIEVVEDLSISERGDNGFGSTGKNSIRMSSQT